MGDEHLFAEELIVHGNDDWRGNAGQVAVLRLLFFCEDERNERGARLDDFQAELTGEVVAHGSCANLGDGEPAGGNDKHWRAKFGGVGADDKLGGVADFLDFGVENNLDTGVAALGFEQAGDVLRRTVAEKLPKRFFVIRDAMLLDEGDEVAGSVAGERRFREMLVGAEEVFGARVDVREITAAAAGDEDFFADAIGAFEDGDAAAAFAGFGGAEESGGARAEDECVKFVRRFGQAFAKPRSCQLSLRSFLRLN